MFSRFDKMIIVSLPACLFH